jgi:protein-S-isoprenylcysteine O-methyltransferase Ste14
VGSGELVIFALAGLLALVPALVDRWALERGASPQALIALAAVTLLGVAAVPVTFAICTGGLALQHGDSEAPSVEALAGLLLVAIAAGRTLARVVAIRHRWRTLARTAAALELPEISGARILPVGELLAFVSGSEAFVSRGLLERLSPAQRDAVIQHEREHAERGHARLTAAARALAHGTLGIAPARRAAEALDRELDVLADLAAARRLGDARPVQDALRAVAAATRERTVDERSAHDGNRAHRRIERLSDAGAPRAHRVDALVRLVTFVIGAFVLASVCLAIHVGSAWLGVLACAALLASLAWFTRPILFHRSTPTGREIRHE